ncbi:FimV/HubP family polar landmark protein [Azotobacter beijerinckii]|uniref:FimV/HubP family polar landmark protein n=1 Tax=Azotobacter beijerinckii TaxID=170623 RepID=UPI0029541459|nr:FimV/HubP family polar landmark protein [Azotobacter beijerinckii]MDV7210520.1 FimV/HubP family polar landmark protein [Azotobacter beijerinckii]
MVRVRKLALAIAAASALSSGAAHALGLGEVTLRSTLNQPLDAEIELLEARDIGSEELAPALASPEEFNKAGVDRQYFLSDLKFTPIIKPNGKSVIRVTSSKPVREPYLNFLVEVLWPSGRLLREYTLLLDPPLYSSQTAMSAAQKPLTEQRADAVPRAPAATPRPIPPRPEASGRPTATAKEYRTTARDTLWTVAERVRTSGTVHQTMLAIQDLNPNAFLDGNINRLLSGQVLRLPDEQQIRRRSESQALADVAAQNSAWRERRARPAVASTRQLDATRRSDADAVPARVETGDNLRLVAVDSGKAVAGSDKGGDGKASADKLALAKENLDATQRENTELKSRMDDLQGQLDKLQRLITLKDEQLAKLQTSLVQPDKVAGVAAGSAASTPPVVPGAPEPAAVTQPVAATVAPALAPAAAGVASAAPTVPPVVPPETPSAQPAAAAEAPAQPVAEPVATAVPAAQPVPSKPEPAPAKPAVSKPVRPAVEPEQSVGLVDSILGSPLLLPSLGGSVAAALLLGLLAARRRAAKQAELEKDDEDDAPEADARPDTGLLRAAIDVSQADEGSRTEPGWDALVEAEDHLAHGRLNQAAELLQAACKAEPKRSDLRLKLMEVQAELGDREGFAREERVLRETAGAQQPQVDHLKMKYPAMAGFAAAALAGGALAVGLGALEEEEIPSAATQEFEPNSPLSEADIDLSLDDLEAELERDLQGGGQDDPSLSLDDLALDDSSQPTVSALEPLAEDFSFDLELPEETDSFDLEDDLKGLALDLEAPVEPISAGDKDFLGLDLDALDAPAVARAEAASSEEALLEEGLFDSFDLAANADFSDASEPLAPSLELPPADKLEEKAEADGFMSQLDELDVELEQLAAGLGGEVDEGKPAMHSLEALDALEEGEDFDFLADADEIATKLDLARAYIEMGDSEGARDILDEVLSEGNEAQRQEAREMSVSLA